MSFSTQFDTIDPSKLALPGAHAPVARQPKRYSRHVAADLVGMADIAAVIAGSFIPALVYANAGGIVTNWVLLTQTCLAAAIVAHICLRSWGMYDTGRMHDFPIYPGRLFLIVAGALVGVQGLGLPHAIRPGHVGIWFTLALAASFTLLLIVRSIAQPILARLTAAGRFDKSVAVFGAGPIARRVYDHLADPELGIRFAGVYDDRKGEDRISPEGLAVAGRLDDLIVAARNEEIDQIVIALPQGADRRIASVARKLEQLPVSLHIVTHIASDLVDAGPAYKVSSLGSVGLIDVKKKPLTDWSPLVKNMEDLIIGSAMLVASVPLFAIIAVAIKVDSPGPVFFRQRRRGLNQRVIEMLKFRTMCVLEDGDEVRQARPNDDRVTRVGRILRRTSLDELPQLINVLRGEMSLVGPRPHALIHDEQFGEMLEHYANRHQVKPGMTGLAQVKGLRGELSSERSIEARVAADIDYIKDWSLWLDLRILTQTIWAVATGHNAH